MKTTQEWMAETMQPILDRIAGGPMTAEEERDARERMALIDAAPDLLEALRWYVENDDVNIGQEGNGPYEAGLRRAQAAIAKATGASHE